MVFKSITLFARCRGPDEFWRKRKIFKLAAHYKGRRRNCYSLAIRNVHRAMVYATKGRLLKKEDMKTLWKTRINAACEEHGLTFTTFKESLDRCNVLLNNKVLSELAVWEPRTFKALSAIAYKRAVDDGFNSINDLGSDLKSDGIITRGMFKPKNDLDSDGIVTRGMLKSNNDLSSDGIITKGMLKLNKCDDK